MADALSLNEYQWENRLIVAFADEQSGEAEFLRQWASDKHCELSDRDVLLFVIDAKLKNSEQIIYQTNSNKSLDVESINALSSKRLSTQSSLEILLIGKDGGLKSRVSTTDALNGLLKEIDSMPMRQREASYDRC